MLLLIDNYDSFTYNLYQYLSESGTEVEVRRNDQVTLDEIAAMQPERIVISPGPCTPNEAGLSCEIIAAFGPCIPILGVCLGHQAIGKAFFAACPRPLPPIAIIASSLTAQTFRKNWRSRRRPTTV
jgi:anthranilate synthase/aminodeoxychorismate synthase-like glutamine amidotransferase